MSETAPPALAAFQIGFAIGQYSSPYSGVGIDSIYETAEIKVFLDRPLLGSRGAVGYLDYNTRQVNHGYNNIFLTNLDVVAQTAQRGTYTITRVEVSDPYGHLAIYSPADLAAKGYTTSFAIRDRTPGDVDGDNLTDILFRNGAGTISTWLADRVGNLHFDIMGALNNQALDPAWKAVETFNFTGGYSSSLLLRKTDGSVGVLLGSVSTTSDGHGVTTTSPNLYQHAPIGAEWTIAATGDYNGDGKSDLLWRRDDGAISTWSSTGTGFAENSYWHDRIDTHWTIEGSADFDGDGRADILWRNTDGSLSTWTATGDGGFRENSWFHMPIDRSWHVVGLGDFDGDGRADMLWRNDNGAVSAWISTGTGFTENRFNAGAATNWQVAQIGDYNGDGLSDILWRNGDGQVSVWQSTGSDWAQNTYLANAGSDWSIAAHHFTL